MSAWTARRRRRRPGGRARHPLVPGECRLDRLDDGQSGVWCRTVRDSGLVGQPPHQRPGEAADLQKWIQQNPGRINRQHGAFCDTPLHSAARFGREDLADLLIAAGANVEARNELDERPLHASATYGHPTVANCCWREALTSTRAARAENAAARRGVRRRPAVGRRSTHRGREAAPCGRRRCECARTRQRLHAAAMRDVVGKPQHGDGEPAPLARRRPRGAE